MSEVGRVLEIVERIDGLMDACDALEAEWADAVARVHPDYRDSAVNLLHCVAVNRAYDPAVDEFLHRHGLMGWQAPTLQSRVMHSLLTTRDALLDMLPGPHPPRSRDALGPRDSQELLRRNADELFGPRPGGRTTRIMVTFPTTAATDAALVRRLTEAGMDAARINCAHEGPEAWEAMMANIRSAAEAAGREVRVAMDLPGPKIRTGPIGSGPQVVKIKPDRDRLGRVYAPGRAVLLPEGATPPVVDDRILPVPVALVEAVEPGDQLHFQDARGKARLLRVTSVDETLEVAGRTLPMARVQCEHTIYAESGTPMMLARTGEVFAVGEVPAKPGRFWLRPGDRLILDRGPEPGRPAVRDDDGTVVVPARVACTWPGVFEHVRAGEPVAFDDGAITGVVRENRGDALEVEIVRARPDGSKLKADKGINFPASTLGFQGLTDDDREQLPFVAAHADALNLSFVRTAADVEELLRALDGVETRERLGIVLKIETMSSIANLVPILLTAMRSKPVGVMIARGDLAVESGWHYMGFAQEAILTLCHAAHLPTVWASQVLESLAKEGVPSRAEITDVVMAERAECVMLNKGDYVDEAVELLDSILLNQETLLARRRQLFGIPREGEEAPGLSVAGILDPRWHGPDTTLEELLADGSPASSTGEPSEPS